MKKSKNFTIRARLRSFRFAIKGLIVLFPSEHNLWIHSLAAVVAILLGVILNVNRYEWIAIIIAIGMVFSAEIFNSAIERIVDYFSPERDDKAGMIKNISAAAVLVTAIASLITGLIIFLPRII